jgi:hypothetical protein
MPVQSIDPATQIRIIRNLSEKLRTYFIFPDIAEQICERLQKHLEAGEYDDITESGFFAYALTQHLHEINHDEHLWVRWYPEPMPDDEGSLLQNEERLVEFQQRAKQMYVSAKPSGSAVGFYLSQGFRPADTPIPELYELEPENIHMLYFL